MCTLHQNSSQILQVFPGLSLSLSIAKFLLLSDFLYEYGSAYDHLSDKVFDKPCGLTVRQLHCCKMYLSVDCKISLLIIFI